MYVSRFSLSGNGCLSNLAVCSTILPLCCRDFDSLLYLCQPAFQHLPLDTLTRLSATLLLPLYLVTIAVLLALVVLHLWRAIAER